MITPWKVFCQMCSGRGTLWDHKSIGGNGHMCEECAGTGKMPCPHRELQ